MLLSLALIFLCGLFFGGLFQKLKLPGLIGMLLSGVLLGPYALNALDENILNISADLRQTALIVILLRAGLQLNIQDLKKVGRPALLMCFVPACFEIAGMMIFAPLLFGVSLLEAVILGTVVAAVSPAVVVPKMLHIMDSGYGKKKSIPQMIMAGASVDDVFVIVLFTVFTGLAKTGVVTPVSFFAIPTAIIFGLTGGFCMGIVLSFLFSKIHMRDSIKIIAILSVAFLLITAEHLFTGTIGFSGLLSVMAMGITLQHKKCEVSKRLSQKFSKLWTCFEILLFVLVGASVNIPYISKAGIVAVVLILCVLIFRIVGVFMCLIHTHLNKKEKLFSAMAYVPKATVQAAIGGLPLAMGLSCGSFVLAVSVLAIIITAPLGAIFIETTYTKLLTKE